jgi:hypothetical protein
MKLRLLLSVVLLAVLAPAASAADHEFTLSSAKTLFEWQGAADVTRGSPVNDPATREQLGCATPTRPCEEVLLKVEEAGKLIAHLEAQQPDVPLTADVDGYLFKSDASGARGDQILAANADGPDTIAVPKAAPGYYLLVVDYYSAYNTGYDGELKFTAAAPPPVVAPPAVTAPAVTKPAPTAGQKLAAKRKACAKKARKMRSAKKRKAALKRCARLKK